MSLESTRISDIMNKDVKVEEQNQTIFAISRIMSDNNIGSVVIVDNHKNKNPVGIVTERDIIRIVDSLQPMNFQLHLKDHMSRPVITISSNASISDAMKIMYERKIRRVIITEGDNLVGIVTEHDIFKLLMNNKDLLSNVIEDSVPIPRNQIIEDLSHFWFDNTFLKQ